MAENDIALKHALQQSLERLSLSRSSSYTSPCPSLCLPRPVPVRFVMAVCAIFLLLLCVNGVLFTNRSNSDQRKQSVKCDVHTHTHTHTQQQQHTHTQIQTYFHSFIHTHLRLCMQTHTLSPLTLSLSFGSLFCILYLLRMCVFNTPGYMCIS